MRPLVGLFLLCVSAPAQSAWYVQMGGAVTGSGGVVAPFPSIQQAIVAASAGDVVIVGPGTYNENIDFLGKAVTVRSSGGALATTIQGDGTRSVVWCINYEGPGSALDGFTVTGGANTTHGGGVRIWASHPIIRNCLIYGNTSWDGGGITCSSASGALIEGCTITGNGASVGGGLFLSSSSAATVIRDCVVWGNTATNGPAISGAPVTVAYSCVESGWSGAGNIAADPMLASDYSLLAGSPCIGAASGGADMGAVPTQLPMVLSIYQPYGAGASVRIDVCEGVPWHLGFSLFTTDAANAAGGLGSGKLFGLHMGVGAALQQISSLTAPYFMPLDSSGGASLAIPPLPASFTGVAFHAVSVAVDPWTAMVSESAPPITYVYQ